jgi:hypothetical protein
MAKPLGQRYQESVRNSPAATKRCRPSTRPPARNGVGVGSNIAKSSGAFFYVWTLFALGVTALFSVILSVRGLWNLQRRESR